MATGLNLLMKNMVTVSKRTSCLVYLLWRDKAVNVAVVAIYNSDMDSNLVPLTGATGDLWYESHYIP